MKRSAWLALLIAACPLVGHATSVRAQQVPLRDLPKAAREIDEPFSLITAVAEIKPGMAAVYDGVDGELSTVTFANGSRAVLGRTGSGPGEYRTVAGVFRMQGDTLWVLDAMQMRIVAFTPQLKPGPSFPFMLFDAKTSSALTAPFGSDSRGRLYASALEIRASEGRSGPTMQFPDSVDVVRVDPRAGGERTVLSRLRYPISGKPEMKRNGTNIKYTLAFPGLVAADAYAVFPDGRVAIVRGASYTVEFLTPDGRRTAPARIAYDRVRVTDADRKAEMDEARRQAEEQGRAVRKMMPAGVTMQFELLPPASWPEFYPPISPLGALAAPDGHLWVKRAVPVRLGREQWDVISPAGVLVARWRLPAKTTLLALGTGVVYAVRTDADDLRYVQQVVLPR
jgi:hypothetical protein